MILIHGHGLFKTKDSVAMVQAVSGRSITAEDRVRSQASPCGMRCGKRGTWTGFFLEYSGVRYNGLMLQRTVLSIKSGCYNELVGILSADVVRACA